MDQAHGDKLASGDREAVRRIWRGFFFSLALVAVLILVKIWIEGGQYGQWVTWATYDLIQTRLSSDETHVVIVDISDLKPVPARFHDTDIMVTPRKPIEDLLRAIVKQGPHSVGVDIDFSPKEGDFMQPGDPEFFQHCLDLSVNSGVPVFLGVFRTQYEGRAGWLGDSRFSLLAATIGRPSDDNTRATAWLEPAGTDGAHLPSLSAALAGFDSAAESPWLSWAVEWTRERKVNSKRNKRADRLVDYGSADALRNSAIRTWQAAGIDALPGRLSGKIVILGDIADFSAHDAFVIPGAGGHDVPAPGVLVHACAAETLLTRPLCEFTDAGRLALDVLLSVCVLGAMTGLCLYAVRIKHDVNIHLLHTLLNGLAIVLVFLFGVLLVKTTRVIWDDFLLVILALIVHRPCERFAHAGIHWLKHWGKELWEQIFPPSKKEEEV